MKRNILFSGAIIILYLAIIFIANYLLNINIFVSSIILLIILIGFSIIRYFKYPKEKTLKDKAVIFLPIILCCIISTILFFNNVPTLTYVEEQVYDKVILMVNEDGFFNPKEVRLLDVVVKYEYSDIDRKYVDTIDTYYIKVIGTNKVGGTINKCYEIYYSDYSQEWTNYSEACEDIYKTGMGYEQLSSDSVKNINKALQKYWENLGL